MIKKKKSWTLILIQFQVKTANVLIFNRVMNDLFFLLPYRVFLNMCCCFLICIFLFYTFLVFEICIKYRKFVESMKFYIVNCSIFQGNRQNSITCFFPDDGYLSRLRWTNRVKLNKSM